MKKENTFLQENFLLENDYAVELYHQYAKDLPIIDYHNHLSPKAIAENKKFENITQLWLAGDHYKWRAMRANGIAEKYLTGDADDWEKFEQWAKTVPYTLRNPLYHWSHLELKRYFGIDELLSEKNARSVYDACNEQLKNDSHSAHGLLKKMKVESLCTTDDPTDDLAFHKTIQESDLDIKVLPTFRPDKLFKIEGEGFQDYINQLAESADVEIIDLNSLLEALHKRMDYFHALGCRLSDHGLEKIISDGFSEGAVNFILTRKLKGRTPSVQQSRQFQSAMLHYLCQAYHERGWVQQFHLGALRNNNKRQFDKLGPDTGFDSIGDSKQARALATMLDRLDQTEQLGKTILYNLNPRDNEVFASMAANFNDGTVAGKMQYGSAWWFLDQLDGMEKQINALSNTGLLSRFIGMLTDSRSFLSFPRHEYFRRLLCNIFGKDIAKGHLPNDMEWIGKVVQDICYHNAKGYFEFDK